MKRPSKADQQEQDYQADSDADLMQRHAEMTADPDRHARATEKLGKRAQSAQDAHKSARKALEKKTKGRLKKTFGGKGDKGNGGTVEAEQDREQGDMQRIVNEG